MIKQLYKKVRKNLLARIRRYKKLGYITPEIPKIPKKVTSGSVRRLEKIGKDLIKKLEYIDVSTGEILSYRKSLKIRKELKKQQNKFENVPSDFKVDTSYSTLIIENAINYMYGYSYKIGDIFKDYIYKLQNKFPDDEIARMLEFANNNDMFVTDKIWYVEVLIETIKDMMDFLPDLTENERDEFYEYFDEILYEQNMTG